MTGKTHQVAGIIAGLGTYLLAGNPNYQPATLGAVVFGAHLASLFPDLDQGTAQFWSSLPYGRAAGQVVDPLLRHRSISHSVAGLVIFACGTHWLLGTFPEYWGISSSSVWLVAVVAYLSHIILDGLTVEGVPLLWPYKRMFGFPPRPFQGMRVLTGKWFENLIVFPLANIILIVLIFSQWEKLRHILLK